MRAVILALPLDIIFLIRNFLLPNFEYEVFGRGESDSIEKFVIQESFWSWRNFLSVRNDTNWKLIRKSARMWTLNRVESGKYLKDTLFRNYIHENMSNSEQLYCKLSQGASRTEFEYPLFPQKFKEILNIGMLGSLCLKAYSGTELPSSASLRVLYLQSCERLNKLGNYPKLQTLNLLFCGSIVRIESIGKMCKLSSISFSYTDARILPSFPLEQLEEIYLDDYHELVLDNLSRFRRLQSLSLRLHGGAISTPVHFNIPSLTSLVLRGFHVVDITGLNRLATLDVTTADTVIGKEVIYPQLISLAGSNETFIKEATAILTSDNNKLKRFSSLFLEADNLAPWLPRLSNVSDVSLTYSRFMDMPRTKLTFHVGEKMNSLVIGFKHSLITGLGPERPFRSLSVSQYTGSDISNYGNIQQLTLLGCYEVQDIHSIRNVPYLIICNCDRIRDFSCLGSQRYLEIKFSHSLSDETISEKFGNILSLRISGCYRVRKLVQISLAKTRRLEVLHCHGLEEVSLAGSDYSIVNIKEQENESKSLKQINITGKAYMLHIPKRFQDSINKETYGHMIEYFWL
jgi:hypothetical protein